MHVLEQDASGLLPRPPTSDGLEACDGSREVRQVIPQRRAVLLLSLGEPVDSSRRAIHRFLAQTLAERQRFKYPHLPPVASKLIAEVRALLRTSRLRRQCESVYVDSQSPMLRIAREQADALASLLSDDTPVFCAMRYGTPSIADAVLEIESLGINSIVAVSMYPHHACDTTFAVFHELNRQVEQTGYAIDLTVRGTWHDDAAYVHAQSRQIREFARDHKLCPDDTHLVYSMRSLPVHHAGYHCSYMDHIHRTAELVSRRIDWPDDRISRGFHGGEGSSHRLGPTTLEILDQLKHDGEKQVLVCPLSQTIDGLETLFEIGCKCRRQFVGNGRRLFVMPALNSFDAFIAALKNQVLRGPHSVSANWSHSSPADGSAVADDQGLRDRSLVDGFFMVGISLPGRLRPSHGPAIRSTDVETFRQSRKSQCEIPDLLRSVCEVGEILEAWLWNTCHRFELYGWIEDSTSLDTATIDNVIRRAQRLILPNGNVVRSSDVNLLRGADAWRHMMRTAAGLNSRLPGERDVLDQLQTSLRVAERAGTARTLSRRLLRTVLDDQEQLRNETAWGEWHPDYCHASISQILQTSGLTLSRCQCIVLGGSTTSCSILHNLRNEFDVADRHLTLLHRGHGHGSRLKELRKAIRNGRRIRVQKYQEQLVLEAIAGADVVFIGLDRREPVLRADAIEGLRDFGSQSLTVFDYNLYGSTSGFDRLNGVHLYTERELAMAATAFVDRMCENDRLALAASEADSWIGSHIPRGSNTKWRAASMSSAADVAFNGKQVRTEPRSGDVALAGMAYILGGRCRHSE